MKLKQLKTSRDLKLANVQVEFVQEESKLVEIILRPEGEEFSYSIRPGESYTNAIRVYERRAFETKTVLRLKGSVLGLNVHQDFDTPEEASRRADELRDKDPSADLAIAPVDIRVDEVGEPVRGSDDDIPF